MKNNSVITALCLFGMLLFASCDNSPKFFGQKPSMPDSPALSVSEVLEPKNHNRMVKMAGVVQTVCKTEGCWLVLHDNQNNIRVEFNNSSFFAPMDCDGKKTILEGKIEERVVSQDEARLYAKNAGKSEKEIVQYSGDARWPIFVATSLQFAE